MAGIGDVTEVQRPSSDMWEVTSSALELEGELAARRGTAETVGEEGESLAAGVGMGIEGGSMRTAPSQLGDLGLG